MILLPIVIGYTLKYARHSFLPLKLNNNVKDAAVRCLRTEIFGKAWRSGAKGKISALIQEPAQPKKSKS